MLKSKNKFKYILVELAHHLPYSIFGVMVGLLTVGVLTFIAILAGVEDRLSHAAHELFHVFHGAHILFSAVATTAMFFKHDTSIIKAVLVGLIGSISVCTVSDIILPYYGGKLLGMDMHLHLCFLTDPGLVLTFLITGVVAGLMVTKGFEKSTEYSHSAHVFVSSISSILYLLGFGVATGWMESVDSIFLVTVVSVMIPCCASDIAFPLACTHKHCSHD